jgi:hydroxypyruvate isomerase
VFPGWKEFAVKNVRKLWCHAEALGCTHIEVVHTVERAYPFFFKTASAAEKFRTAARTAGVKTINVRKGRK